MSRFLLVFSVFFLGSGAYAQGEKGFVRGNIADGDFGGPMIAAAVTVAEMSGVGTTTDFDGNYSLSLDPGVYTIEVSFISYATQSFPAIEVKPGEVTIIDAVLTSAASELKEFEVQGEIRRNNEVAMLMDMKNATNVTDGLSSQSFRKIGDSDLSGAIKRVTGVTVQNGKYVYVRGLGDRYTKTTLNGMTIPGLDPDVNSVQIDIFPTSVLENVAVYKTFSPDLDGDFTGGLVNVVTKSFPEEKTSAISIGLTYVPSMHFNSDYILYNQGSLDWLGFDDGSRKMPFPSHRKVPNEALIDPTLEDMTRSFNPQLAVKSKTAFPNGSFSYNRGNQYNRENGSTLGYNAVVNYANEHIFYSDFQSNDYLKDNDRSVNELFKNVTRTGVVGKNNVMWSGLLSGSYKKDKNSYSAMFLMSQNGESSAAKRINQDFNQNQATLVEDVLTYSQRSLATLMLTGSHRVSIAEVKWGLASSYSRVYDPDFRETRISIGDGDTALSTGTGAGIDRFWRELNEINESAKVDVTLPLSERVELKTGASGTVKFRDFATQAYKHRRTNLNDIEVDPDWFLQDENIWSAEAESPNYRYGTYTLGNFQPANQYQAQQNIFSGYALLKHPVLKVVKLIYGLRVEKTDMFYTGENNTGSVVYDNEKTLDAFNLLPSVNAVYAITEKMNLRAAANRTVARPSFKEKSIAQIYDPITKRTFVGNIDLEQTNINNFDLRYEFFMQPKELFSVAAFYKQFDGHIELVSFPTAPDNLKPRNSGQAEVFGAEMEIRKSIGSFVESKFFSRFFVSGNVTLVRSMVDLKSVIVDNTGQTEFDLRENNLRTEQTLTRFRPMAGQSPYAFNGSISYEIPESKTNISLAYNVQGEQLTIIASGRVPDIYTIPFHSLNFNAYRNFGKDLRSRVTIGVANILDEDRTLVYRSYGAEDQIYTTYKPGLGISAKYSYTF